MLAINPKLDEILTPGFAGLRMTRTPSIVILSQPATGVAGEDAVSFAVSDCKTMR